MSEICPEDIKKICLICGCHTKQAINIYEPRNGPNIIELIQAKFKFQPVNEDKYLCYSCNNWLINWHSLQTLNSSSNCEFENGGQSSKFRSNINESIPEEDCESDENLKVDKNHQQNQCSLCNCNNEMVIEKQKQFYSSERRSIKRRRIRKIHKKYKHFHVCATCGRVTRVKLPIKMCCLTKKISFRCKTCTTILDWIALLKEENTKLKHLAMTKLDKHYYNRLSFQSATDLVQDDHEYQQQSLVDSKIVEMLRNLGTTLTRESDCRLDSHHHYQQPQQNQINDDEKQHSSLLIRKRKMEENEILLDFNTTITEVLQPYDHFKDPITGTTLFTEELINSNVKFNEEDEEIQNKSNLEAIYEKIPKCVTISIIEDENDSKNVAIN